MFVVTRNTYAEGSGAGGWQTARFDDLILIGVFDPSPPPTELPRKDTAANTEWLQDPWGRYYQPGATYELFSGGAKAGKVTVDKHVPFQCQSSVGVLRPTAIKFSKGTYAVATSASTVRSHADYRRAADQQERETALRVARRLLEKRQVNAAEAGRVEIEKLVVTRLLPETWSMIGDFQVRTKSAIHRLFLVVDLLPSGPAVSLEVYNRAESVEDGNDDFHESFVDQADLDGDGEDEFVTEVLGYENEAFTIYKRIGNEWKRVASGGESGC